MSLRLRYALIGLLGITLMALGSAYIFSTSWIQLVKTYGLLTLKHSLDNLNEDELSPSALPNNQWALRIDTRDTSHKQGGWIRKPSELGDVEAARFAAQVLKAVRATKLRDGSFETSITTGLGRLYYFVAFRQSPQRVLIAGSSANRGLRELKGFATPFLSVFLLAYLLCAVLFFVFSSYVSSVYRRLGRAMENIGAGKLENLEIPKTSDRELSSLANSVQLLARLLNERNEKLALASKLADEDSMTDLPNYRAFSNYIKGIVTELRGQGDTHSVLCIVDLDHFKRVNDTHGHQVGDLVLKVIAQLIKDNVRSEDPTRKDRIPDFYGRYGGEEFVIVYARAKVDSMHVGAVRLLHAIRNCVVEVPAEVSSTKQPFSFKVTASMGLCSWRANRFNSTSEWIKAADEALYAAKSGGRDRVVILEPEKRVWT